MATTAVGRGRIAEAVSELRTFTQGNVKAKWHDLPRATDRGRLPWSIILPETRSYVVYSYITPIAWYCLDETRWYMPHVWYSPTTQRHQNIVVEAIPGEE
jgi:hypothetical protein